jgi:hypothetical protein
MDPKNAALFANGSNLKAAPQRWTAKASSSSTSRYRTVSKAGDRDVRVVLYAVANTLLVRSMANFQIKSWGMRLMRTKGRRRAVARKLAVLMRPMWIDGTEFRQDQVGGMA